MSDVRSIRARVGDGAEKNFTGRAAWALHNLIQAGLNGCTPINHPGPRWSDYTVKIRRAGIDVRPSRKRMAEPTKARTLDMCCARRLKSSKSKRRGCDMATYHADIHEAPNRDGNFVAVLRDATITTMGPDPEHDLCHAMVEAGLPDGEIQFWRGATRSLFYRSVHRAAGYRVKMGETFPHELVKRREAPGVFAQDRLRLSAQN